MPLQFPSTEDFKRKNCVFLQLNVAFNPIRNREVIASRAEVNTSGFSVQEGGTEAFQFFVAHDGEPLDDEDAGDWELLKVSCDGEPTWRASLTFQYDASKYKLDAPIPAKLPLKIGKEQEGIISGIVFRMPRSQDFLDAVVVEALLDEAGALMGYQLILHGKFASPIKDDVFSQALDKGAGAASALITEKHEAKVS